MSGQIFLRRSDGQLVGMDRAQTDLEKDLQILVAKYPNLLAGDQIDPERPRRWLLVRREYGVKSEADVAVGRIDHLLLDQDGVPTFVEVKTIHNGGLRREAIAQVIDYAANASKYEPVDRIREFVEGTDALSGTDTVEDLIADEEYGVEEYWAKVAANLELGRVRLIILSEAIPPEMRAIVEFMNRQMSPAEVLAVEVRQYEAEQEDQQILVPIVYGLTEEARQRKKASGGVSYDVGELLNYAGPAVQDLASHLHEYALEAGEAVEVYPTGSYVTYRLKGEPFFWLKPQKRKLDVWFELPPGLDPGCEACTKDAWREQRQSQQWYLAMADDSYLADAERLIAESYAYAATR